MRIQNVPKYESTQPSFYSLKDSSGVIIREGITTRLLSKRIREYKKEPWFSKVEEVCVQPFNNVAELMKYEKARVTCDSPTNNKQLKTDCPSAALPI
jgi:hypothetical protein